ncbi:DNA-binding protein [Neisseria animalis]|uniref:DNA-binding protein n=1 Tax=Neisseria animalis TaxID=492 RepID=A0A5P3MNI6_NEIAN|nr:DNA-binding protein [Neisseria animalis]QEY23104.1 DNA-binding protein [Neisseria animalis]ROW32436.1 DNA-binding protein [Neisseria animalis]VEE08141.1 Uncharacterised protein [Neisseria animalis]
MTNNANPSVPAQRYFTLDEMCSLLQISPSQFAQWQHENGIVIGHGGERYTRSDVVKLLKLKDTFAPYVDSFSQGALDADGNPAADAEEVRVGLKNILADLDKALTK